VATIEHGNFLDEESAALMTQHGTYLVPTLTVFEFISRYGREQGLAETTLEKIELGKTASRQGVEIALGAGVRIGSGSDLDGTNGSRRSWELDLKAEVMGRLRALVAATKTNAELLGMGDVLGTLEPGKLADVVVVDGDPLEDITILQDSTKIALVMVSGQVVQGRPPVLPEAESPLIMDDQPVSRPSEFCCNPYDSSST
jgi:imidazolonepropionase-like amidohydrolase